MQAAILAGGLGTRLGSLTKDTPKPMVLVQGKPFIEHELGLLKESGISDFVLCTGYRGESLEGYLGDGSRWGVRIRYSRDGPKLLGPAGALRGARRLLDEEFFVTYGDAYLQMDYAGLMAALLRSKRLGAMAVWRNSNMYGRSDLVVNGESVVKYDKRGDSEKMEWVNFGVSALRRESLSMIPSGAACGEEQFYGELIRRQELVAFPVQNRFYEIGTPESLAEFSKYLAQRTRRR